jgi:hypothetical protein
MKTYGKPFELPEIIQFRAWIALMELALGRDQLAAVRFAAAEPQTRLPAIAQKLRGPRQCEIVAGA